MQIYYRQQEDCAIKEAQKVLDRGKRRSWQLGRGLGRTQNGLVFHLLPLCLCILLTREFPVAKITVPRTGRFPPTENCSLGVLEATSEARVSAGP